MMYADTHGWNIVQVSVRVRVIRRKCNLTQGELAWRAGLSRNIITKLESGSHRDVKLSTLVAISNEMRMPMQAWFLPEDEWRKWYDFNIPQERGQTNTTRRQGDAAMNTIRRLLLHGSVRKDMGNGLQFYKALDAASEDDLRAALASLDTRHGRMYSYHRERIRAIRQRLSGVTFDVEPLVRTSNVPSLCGSSIKT